MFKNFLNLLYKKVIFYKSRNKENKENFFFLQFFIFFLRGKKIIQNKN
jgi:hypothetical protein